MRVGAWLLLALTAAACNGWDDDKTFVPRLAYTWRQSAGTVWRIGAGIDSTAGADFMPDGDGAWVTLPNRSLVRKIAGGLAVTREVETPYAPLLLYAGVHYRLALDSTQAYFIDGDNWDAPKFVLPLPAPPVRVLYNNRKFYIQCGARQIIILHETAFAQLATLETTRPVRAWALPKRTKSSS